MNLKHPKESNTKHQAKKEKNSKHRRMNDKHKSGHIATSFYTNAPLFSNAVQRNGRFANFTGRAI